MKIVFSVDALPAIGKQAWRLQQDESWRPCVFAEPLQSGDAQLTDKKEVSAWVDVRLEKDKDKGLKVKGKIGVFDIFVQAILAHIVVHRLSPAPIPDKTQMLQTIAKAKAGTPWLLYLDLAGNFRMLNSEKHTLIGNPDIAVRGEIASTEDYVGEKAAQNQEAMDTLYHQFLAGWLMHLQSKRLGVFIPDAKELHTLESCLTQIKAWQHEVIRQNK